MKANSRSIVILSVVFAYILLQFLWWEVLLVRQSNQIINEKQKVTELGATDENKLRSEIEFLHHKKTMQTVMIVSEGTVFLLLLLFGVYKIKQAMDKEAELGNQQRNFFLSVTHELKTPIAATKLQLQTLAKQKLDEDVRQRLLSNALVENERLNQLIDNILFASRLESEEFFVKIEKTELHELTRSTVQRYFSEEFQKGIIKVEASGEIFANIDPFAFPSVISNLVENGLKYSPDNKQVLIKIQTVGDKIHLNISDSGQGISDDDKKRIFDKFFRAGQEDTRRTKGTGLGLYIVDFLVRKHGGKIRVMDNHPNGTVFEIVLNAA